MSDAIFDAATFMERVWQEVDHLCTAIVEGLAQGGVQANYRAEEVNEEDYAGNRVAYQYGLAKVYPKQKSEGQLVLYFDLTRPGQKRAWPCSQTAILIVAYDAKYATGWTGEHLKIASDGTFIDVEARESIFPETSSGDRLLVWDQSDAGSPWHRRCWAFAVELGKLSGPTAVETEIITPLLNLLKHGSTPNDAFANSSAVTWPRQELTK